MYRLILLLLLLLLPTLSLASDGLLEINQTCAVQTGCFPGDGAGFPVTISQPGTYVLTSHLDYSGVPGAVNVDGIQIRTNYVTLDLRGFQIIGPVTCTGTPVTSCSASGSGAGIEGNGGGNRDEIVIRNGIVRGSGSTGVSCNRGCVVENIHVIENAGSGVSLLNGPGTIRDSTARRNGGPGFRVNGLGTGLVAYGNGGDGVFLNGQSVGSNCVSDQNGGNGFTCAFDVLVDSSARGNSGSGIEASSSCAYGRNRFFGNGIDASGSGGIQTEVNVCGFAPCP